MKSFAEQANLDWLNFTTLFIDGQIYGGYPSCPPGASSVPFDERLSSWGVIRVYDGAFRPYAVNSADRAEADTYLAEQWSAQRARNERYERYVSQKARVANRLQRRLERHTVAHVRYRRWEYTSCAADTRVPHRKDTALYRAHNAFIKNPSVANMLSCIRRRAEVAGPHSWLREWMRGTARQLYTAYARYQKYAPPERTFLDDFLKPRMERDVLAGYMIHPSKTAPERLAYMQSWQKFDRGEDKEPLFTVTTPGKFVQMVNQAHELGIADHLVRDLAAQWQLAGRIPALHVAKGEDEIIRAIFYGPSDSCQSDANGFRYAGHVHPAACFDNDTIDVLYITEDDTPEGRVTGRLIANAATKKAARPYGDAEKMRASAVAAGYVLEREALVGCHLNLIEDDNGRGFVMPYVDAGVASGGGALGAKRVGDHWALVTSGGVNTHDAGYANNGVTEPEDAGDPCSHCGDNCDPGYMEYSQYHDMSLCESCSRNHYVEAYYSSRGDARELIHNDEVVEVDGDYYLNDSEVLAYHDIVACCDCGDHFKIDDMSSVEDGGCCTRCLDRHYTRLDDEWYGRLDYQFTKDDTVETEDGKTILESDAVTTHDGRVYHESVTTEYNGLIYHDDDDLPEDEVELIPFVTAEQCAELQGVTA